MTLEDRLAELDGLDLAAFLSLPGGHWERVERVLRLFVDMYRDGVPDLLSATTPKSTTLWRRRHSLRGAARRGLNDRRDPAQPPLGRASCRKVPRSVGRLNAPLD